MLNDKLRAQFEQSAAMVVEEMPPLWRQLYNKCLEEGFDNEQSLKLVEVFILSTNVRGVNLQ